MKAFLLAAGLGTRLRPLTDTVPKCLILIHDKPLLAWWAELFLRHGVSEALVNTHHLPDRVGSFIDAYNAQETGLTFREYHEAELLGSGGTVAANRDFAGEDKSFLICYADNLTDINLTDLLRFHRSHDGVLTMALFRAGRPEQCGIAEVAEGSRIVDFEEKPAQPKSNLANAGIYIARRDIFQAIPAKGFSDFGKDVLPELTGRMYGYEMREYLIDIGTCDNYRKAQKEWPHDHL
jgi:mannose-1-phosphate guanylyltransferase